ncbi:MAG: PEP-CTERM sorting domain-containing protein [Planctomycetota bacterium]|jgi:MYXO-CTERM domain-containing protein
MTRIACGVAAVLLLANVASGALIWLATGDGTQNGEMTIDLGGTSLVEIWVKFADPVTPPSEGINGMAVMVGMDAIMRGEPGGGDVGDPLHIGFAGAIDQPLPGGLTLFGRGSNPSPWETGDLYDYHLMIDPLVDPPWTDPANQGWFPEWMMVKVDVIIIEGSTLTNPPDNLGFAGGAVAPTWQEMYIYGGVGWWTIEHTFSRGSTETNGVRVNVTPEPGALVLLALGGLAGIRRRH